MNCIHVEFVQHTGTNAHWWETPCTQTTDPPGSAAAVLTSRKHVRKQDTYKVVIACSALQLKAFKRVIPKPLFLVTEDWGSVTVFSPP